MCCVPLFDDIADVQTILMCLLTEVCFIVVEHITRIKITVFSHFETFSN